MTSLQHSVAFWLCSLFWAVIMGTVDMLTDSDSFRVGFFYLVVWAIGQALLLYVFDTIDIKED